MPLGLTQDALSKVKLRKSTDGIPGGGNHKSERRLSEPPELNKRVR